MTELHLVLMLEKVLKDKSSFESGFEYQRYGVVEDVGTHLRK